MGGVLAWGQWRLKKIDGGGGALGESDRGKEIGLGIPSQIQVLSNNQKDHDDETPGCHGVTRDSGRSLTLRLRVRLKSMICSIERVSTRNLLVLLPSSGTNETSMVLVLQAVPLRHWLPSTKFGGKSSSSSSPHRRRTGLGFPSLLSCRLSLHIRCGGEKFDAAACIR